MTAAGINASRTKGRHAKDTGIEISVEATAADRNQQNRNLYNEEKSVCGGGLSNSCESCDGKMRVSVEVLDSGSLEKGRNLDKTL